MLVTPTQSSGLLKKKSLEFDEKVVQNLRLCIAIFALPMAKLFLLHRVLQQHNKQALPGCLKQSIVTDRKAL